MKVKMRDLKNNSVGEFSFKLLMYTGVWRPITLKSFWSIRLYDCCSIIVLSYKFYLGTSFLINIYYNRDNPKIFIENIFFSTSLLLTVFKIIYLIIFRNRLEFLVSLFRKKNCHPRNNEEVKIYNKVIFKRRLVY